MRKRPSSSRLLPPLKPPVDSPPRHPEIAEGNAQDLSFLSKTGYAQDLSFLSKAGKAQDLLRLAGEAGAAFSLRSTLHGMWRGLSSGKILALLVVLLLALPAFGCRNDGGRLPFGVSVINAEQYLDGSIYNSPDDVVSRLNVVNSRFQDDIRGMVYLAALQGTAPADWIGFDEDSLRKLPGPVALILKSDGGKIPRRVLKIDALEEFTAASYTRAKSLVVIRQSTASGESLYAASAYALGEGGVAALLFEYPRTGMYSETKFGIPFGELASYLRARAESAGRVFDSSCIQTNSRLASKSTVLALLPGDQSATQAPTGDTGFGLLDVKAMVSTKKSASNGLVATDAGIGIDEDIRKPLSESFVPEKIEVLVPQYGLVHPSTRPVVLFFCPDHLEAAGFYHERPSTLGATSGISTTAYKVYYHVFAVDASSGAQIGTYEVSFDPPKSIYDNEQPYKHADGYDIIHKLFDGSTLALRPGLELAAG